jgi:hypothetical protein
MTIGNVGVTDAGVALIKQDAFSGLVIDQISMVLLA